jgi:hypothetical protein
MTISSIVGVWDEKTDYELYYTASGRVGHSQTAHLPLISFKSIVSSRRVSRILSCSYLAFFSAF